MDLGKSSSTSASLKKLQEDDALPGRGTMEREAGGTNPQPILGRMVAIEDYVLCGFLPPPSEFLLLVLNFYGLSLLHLNHNYIAFLSIFAHLCEAYIGVEHFLDLFRSYYELRWMESNRISGCVGFRLRDGPKSRYIPFRCPSSRSKWRNRWFYLEIKDSNPVFVVPKEQPDKISSWTAKPPLTPSLQSFIDIIDDLRVRGLSGYEVVANFVGLNSEAMERRVGQVMISGPTTASDIPVPLCEKGAAERDEAINALPLTDIIGPLADHQVAASLKEKVAKEASDAAAATTSGGNVPTKGRKFSSASDASPPPPRRQRIVTIGEKEAQAKATRAKSGGTSSASPAAASTDVALATGSREATPSGPVSDPAAGRGPPAAVLTWEELQVEMRRLLKAGARSIGREIAEARSEAALANTHADWLVRELAEAREDLTKMRELVAVNERQRKGLEDRMSELGNNLSEIRGSLRVTYTGLHQLAGECGIKSTIPVNPDEFSLNSSLAELATVMGEIPSKHAARIAEETSNGIYTGACHVLACVKLSRPELDLREILDQGAASDTREEVMEKVGDLGESVLPLFEEDADDEDVQQRGQPESLAIIPVLEFEPHVSPDNVDQTLNTSSDLEGALASQDRRIQCWKMKFEVAELERTMLAVKKEQAVETLRGRELDYPFHNAADNVFVSHNFAKGERGDNCDSVGLKVVAQLP
uniref:Retrotransposon protein, putative, unclassified n=1 Tax=Oryza sativa subsp. japonica TaxID=39947 RepID=Q2QSG3_ORYSJ|nr:retrotransposon protein, putative, unclassified [Oryza sativa Japonica Group]